MKRLLFLEKKKQKDFSPFSGGGRRPGTPNDELLTEKSSLVLSFKKEQFS